MFLWLHPLIKGKYSTRLVDHFRNISTKFIQTYLVSLETLRSVLEFRTHKNFCRFEQTPWVYKVGWTAGSEGKRKEHQKYVLSLCPCLSIITWLNWKMPWLCLQLVCLSSHSSLRMLIRGSSTTCLNPGDQCKYLRTDCRLTNTWRSVLTDERSLIQTQQY